MTNFNEFVASRRVSELADGFKEMSTLQNTRKWVRKERFGLPEYLLRTCPSSLREGRRLKTKFRLGCHDLRSSSCRMQRVRNAQCPCCESRESETIQHALFECKAFEEEREVFLSRLYSVCPLARQLTDEYRCRLVMGDKLPLLLTDLRNRRNPGTRRWKIRCTVFLLLFRSSGWVS